jgi:hypothetical protein
LDRALTTIDRNPQVLEALLKTVDTAVEDVGQTAQTALGPGGAGTEALGRVGQTAQTALGPGGAVTETGEAVGGAVDDAGRAVGGAATEVGAGQAGQAGGVAPDAGGDGGRRRPASRRGRAGETKRGSKRGTRRSRSSDSDHK